MFSNERVGVDDECLDFRQVQNGIMRFMFHASLAASLRAKLMGKRGSTRELKSQMSRGLVAKNMPLRGFMFSVRNLIHAAGRTCAQLIPRGGVIFF